MVEKNILCGPTLEPKFPSDFALAQLMHTQLQEHKDAVAQIQIETGEELTYKEIFHKSCKLAVYLKKSGIKCNDKVAICSENNLGWAIPVCASLYLGVTLCPLNPTYSKREFHHTVNISKPKIIFVSPSVVNSVKSYVKELSWAPTLILMLNNKNDGGIPSVDKLIEQIPESSLDDFQVTTVDPRDHVIAILCSSGTTGLPKGVMLTDRNMLALIEIMADKATDFIRPGQVIMCLLPFFHAYFFCVLTMGLIAGSTSTIFSQFKERLFLETLQKYKVQVLSLVPPLMVFLAKHPMVDEYDLSSIQIIWCGAAPLSREIEEGVKKRLNNPEIRQAYGMTETTLSVLKIPSNGGKPGSVGVLVPGIQAKVVPTDDDGKWSDKALGPYCEGELCFKGDLIMKGYCGDRQSTSATIDKDGWLHTGDVGYYDKDEYFFVVDRYKELIKYKGFQVPPAELEALLLTHPEIKDAAVVGLPDEEAGELPVAFVVKQQNAKITADDVVKYVNERVSNQKKIRGGVRFLNEIPKNPSGKILRRELRNVLKSKL